MGLLDHQKTWRFVVRAPAADCVEAFVSAFTQGGPLIKKANWVLRRDASGATATYKGRGGLMALVTSLSETASAEQAGAIGSVLTFAVRASDTGSTTCDMWLSTRGTKMGMTADARFIKPYMRGVEVSLRSRDANLQVTKR